MVSDGSGLKRRAEVQAAVGQDEGSRPLGPKTFRDLVRRGLCGLRGKVEEVQDSLGRWGSHLGHLTCFCFPQVLGLAGLVGEAEEPDGEEEEEEEGPLCPEKRFLRLSDGALLLRVLGIM